MSKGVNIPTVPNARFNADIEEGLFARLKAKLALKKLSLKAWLKKMAEKEVGP